MSARLPEHDAPDCPNRCGGFATPIASAEGEHWIGHGDATLFCPACGVAWPGSPEDVEHAERSWAAWVAKRDTPQRGPCRRGRDEMSDETRSADRTRCKPWCGMCSALFRDERRGPVDAAETTVPNHPAVPDSSLPGYGPCPMRCGRWTDMVNGYGLCWVCVEGMQSLSSAGESRKAKYPDWTPPSSAPSARPIGCLGPKVCNWGHDRSCPVSKYTRTAAPRPTPTPGKTCPRCLCTSSDGTIHLETCIYQRERGPSAAEGAPGPKRDTFADLCDEWDLLPDGNQ
jgi:hypothetical protein